MKNDVTRRTVLAGAGTAALSAAVLGSPFGARAQSPTYLNMGSTPSSSGHFAYWVSVGQSVEKGTDGKFVVNVMETNSSIDNARRLRRGEIEFGLSAADAVAMSYFGKGVFEKEGRDETIRQLWIYVGAPNIFVVRADAGVKTLADLDGKPYNAGIPGSSSEQMALATFKTLGIQPKLHKGSTGAAANATRDGQIIGSHKSAASASTPDASFVELGATTDITVIPFKEDELLKVVEAYPYYSPITVPGGVYKGQDTDFRTTVVAPGSSSSPRAEATATPGPPRQPASPGVAEARAKGSEDRVWGEELLGRRRRKGR